MDYIGNKIFLYENIKSTQQQALSIVKKEKDNAKNLVIVSRTQSDGKGRFKRKWFSPYGGLWFSMILKPNIIPNRITLFPLIAGISICETIKEMTNIESKLKWPNDVLIDNKKVAGIIIDAEIDNNEINYIIVGIGINVNFTINDVLTNKIQENKNDSMNSYPVTTLKDENNGNELDVNKFLGKLLKQIDRWCKDIPNYKNIIKTYLEFSDTIGKKITYSNAIENGSATAYNIDDDGSLIVKLENGKIHKINLDTSIRHEMTT